MEIHNRDTSSTTESGKIFRKNKGKIYVKSEIHVKDKLEEWEVGGECLGPKICMEAWKPQTICGTESTECLKYRGWR